MVNVDAPIAIRFNIQSAGPRQPQDPKEFTASEKKDHRPAVRASRCRCAKKWLTHTIINAGT